MRQPRWTGNTCWALGVLVATSLWVEPIWSQHPPPTAAGGIPKQASRPIKQPWPEFPSVEWTGPKDEIAHRRVRPSRDRASQQLAALRRRQSVDGTGVGIGVLSTGVAAVMAGEAAEDLRDRVTVLPGQAGEGDDGTATLSILHDLAPGADLYFATGLGGPARFAANLEALCQAGADVIVDDLFDYQTTIGQGGLQAQAVKAAVRNGCVYVSAAGGQNQAGIWEREFLPGRSAPNDFSRTGDSAGSKSDLSSATCVSAANPDFETFCGASAPLPEAAAMVALILEAAGGFHHTSPEALRAAVSGGMLRIESETKPLTVPPGPAVRRIEISSSPAAGRETYGIGDGTGQTTAQLQAPTGYSGIYADWNVDLNNDGTSDDPWHFGTDAQYPALKTDFDESGTATWQEFGYQLREGPTLTATAGPTQVALTWTPVTVSHWDPPPSVTYSLTRDDGATSDTLGGGLSVLTFTETDVTAGTTNTYQVATVVAGGEATRIALVETTALPNMWLNPPASDPVAAVKSAATYSVTFQGTWTTSVTSDGLPSGAHFTTLIGGVYNAGVTFLREGGMASAGVESMAELGGTSTLASEIRAAAPNALSVLQSSGGNIGPTGSSTINMVTLTTDHPRVTLLTMVAPSPDWFVGVSGLSLLDAQGDWLASCTVNLYPWDAGTEEGTEFSLNNSATSPQETITSLRGMGKFSNEPIATLTFTRQLVNTAPELTLAASPAAIVEAGGSAMVTVEITNGVTFAEDQEIALSFAGTATKGTDYTVALESLTLTAGQSSVATTVTAVQDRVDDDAETILITASHGGGTIGAEQTITIIDDDPTTCSGGMAGTYPCSNVDLMSFLALADIGGGSANDIWGWTDSSTGKEYAIMGRTNGTSFVDISDPLNPIYLGNLPRRSANSTFRDIKVYADHAFIVTEANNSGMQVFDLTQLRTVASPPATFSETAHYPDFLLAHNLVINEDSGFAYAVGTNTCSGGLHMINIQTPTSPTSAGCFSDDGYTHDAQCVNYDGPDLDHQGKEICFNSNVDTLTIVDVTNKADPVMLARKGYSGSRYTHQGWLTEDQAYFLLGDELDEKNNPDVTNTRTYMWDVSDLDEPALIGSHDSTTTAIDHNLYVKGKYTYQSNYYAGLRILDFTDIANGNLSEAAFFDFNPGSDPTNTRGGTWSNYPFFDSGIVIVSVIEQGLFILRPNLVDVVNPALASAAVNGVALTLTYGEALDESSTPATDAFTVTVAGDGRTVTHVSVSGRVVTLTLASVVAHHETVTVGYSPGTNPIRDAAGNAAIGLSNRSVTNETPETALPNMWLNPPASDPVAAVKSAATYSVTFQGTWTTTVTSDGLPSGAHFTTLIGSVHNAGVTFLREGGMASAGVELMAELGGTSTLANEVRAAEPDALSVVQGSGGNIGPTGSSTINMVTLGTDHPRVTLLTMVAPSPDWFVGVSGLSLLDAQGDWLASRTVNLYPWDAGTEEGTEFSLNNSATSPQETITSLRGTGKFSNEPIATLTFTRQSVNTAPSFSSGTSFETDENQTAAATLTATDPDRGDGVAYAITGGADASKFDIGETTGVLTFKVPPNYERAADVASTDPPNEAGNNEYIVAVTATGGAAERALTVGQTITVSVRNVEEAGTVSFSQVGAAIRARLSDPDGGVSSAAWQWARSSERSTGWTNISGATSARYTPSSGDQEMYLRATVSYDDGHDSGKQAQGISSSEIAPLDLQVDTLVSGLSIPWGIAFAPDGTMLFTERSGVLSSRLTDGTVQTVTADFSDLFAIGETGLMGIVVDPSFASSRRFYTCQGHSGPELQVITWTVNADYTQATRVADPWSGVCPPAAAGTAAAGCVSDRRAICGSRLATRPRGRFRRI